MAVIGDDELASGRIKIKKMEDGSETEVAVSDLVEYCKNNL
jgi:histidyl-tRNA synthetase